MGVIRSVQDVCEAFPSLKWKETTDDVTCDMMYAICGGDKGTGDITILLAMGPGAQSSPHRHNKREGWPFRESITCLIGEVYGLDPNDSSFVLKAGKTLDIKGDEVHIPYTVEFALLIYRQPAGHELVSES